MLKQRKPCRRNHCLDTALYRKEKVLDNKITIILEAQHGRMGLNFRAEIGSFKLIQKSCRWHVFFGGDEEGVDVQHCPDFYVYGSAPQRGVVTVRLVDSVFQWHEVDHARNVLSTLRADCLGTSRALVKVSSGGDVAGSNLTGKVKIKLADGRTTTQVVPASQVEAIDGALWIPKWLAWDRAKGRGSLAGPFRLPEPMEAALAAIEHEFERQVKLLQEIAIPLLEKWNTEAPARAAKEAQEKEQQLAEYAQSRALAEQERRMEKEREQVKQQKALKRILALPIHAENVVVTARDWIRVKGSFCKQEWEVQDATVRVSGKRAYIFAPGKEEPVCWKPLNTIEIVRSQAGA